MGKRKFKTADELNITIGQLAIAWTLHQPYVAFSLVGTTNPKQMLINLKANEIELNSKTLEQLESAYQRLETYIKEKYNTEVHLFRGLNEKFY